MAISDRIKAEAERTIAGMQKYYDRYSDDTDDAEELEHRIARVTASMEGCNGFTQDEKIQKTAENVFELTCAQERSYDALRVELKRNRDEYKDEFAVLKAQNASDFSALKKELREGLDGVMKKIEESGMDSSATMPKADEKMGYYKTFMKMVGEHPSMMLTFFTILLVLVFVSGHLETILRVFKPCSAPAVAPQAQQQG